MQTFVSRLTRERSEITSSRSWPTRGPDPFPIHLEGRAPTYLLTPSSATPLHVPSSQRDNRAIPARGAVAAARCVLHGQPSECHRPVSSPSSAPSRLESLSGSCYSVA